MPAPPFERVEWVGAESLCRSPSTQAAFSFSPSVRSFVPCIAEQGHKNCCFRAQRQGRRKEGRERRERKARQQPSLKEVKDTQYRVPQDSDKVDHTYRATGQDVAKEMERN